MEAASRTLSLVFILLVAKYYEQRRVIDLIIKKWAIQKHETQSSRLFKMQKDGIIITELAQKDEGTNIETKFNVSFVNDSIREMFAFDALNLDTQIPDEVLNSRCFKRMTEEAQFDISLFDLLSKKTLIDQSNCLELKMRIEGKSERSITVTNQNLLSNGNQCEITTFRDTTVQVELRTAQEQNKTTSLLVSSVTHELITPLRCIVSMTDQLF
jgi:signal transduction histidine kinase